MHRPSAFTLIEVLLTLALLALVTTVVISGMTGLFRMQEDRPDHDFWQAVTAARQQALDQEEVVFLHFDEKSHDLIWAWPGGQKSTPLPGAGVRFLPEEKTATKLLGGVLFETGELEGIRFYPDGTCDAFRAEIVAPNGRKDLLRVDPWTCAPILTSTS